MIGRISDNPGFGALVLNRPAPRNRRALPSTDSLVSSSCSVPTIAACSGEAFGAFLGPAIWQLDDLAGCQGSTILVATDAAREGLNLQGYVNPADPAFRKQSPAVNPAVRSARPPRVGQPDR